MSWTYINIKLICGLMAYKPNNLPLQPMREEHQKLQSLGVHPGLLNTKLKLLLGNNLGQYICNIFVSVNLFQLHQFLINCSTNLMISHVNVFDTRMVGRILVQLKNTMTVTINDILTLLHIELLNELFHPHYLFPCFSNSNVLSLNSG